MSEEMRKPYTEQPGEYPDHQLVPLQEGMYNFLFRGPPDTDIGDLHTAVQEDEDGKAVVSSGWMPTTAQKAQIAAGAHIRVSLWTWPLPPMAVAVEPPICACHGEEMDFAWDGLEYGGYYCAHTPPDVMKAAADRTPLDQAHMDFKPEPVEDND